MIVVSVPAVGLVKVQDRAFFTEDKAAEDALNSFIPLWDLNDYDPDPDRTLAMKLISVFGGRIQIDEPEPEDGGPDVIY